MRKLALGAVGVVLLSSVAAFATFGGWAVVKVSKIPDAWVAGRPLQLQWEAWQHGNSPLHGLEPTLEARSGANVVQGTTWEFEEDGVKAYRGRLVFPEKGDWQVTIHSGFGTSKAVLLPWRVVDSVRAIKGTVEEHVVSLGIPRFSEAEHGRRLFVSQGCVDCHTHREVPIKGQASTFGPDLTERRFPADYLKRFLENPSIKPSVDGKRMPNMALREKEILPLIAFINEKR